MVSTQDIYNKLITISEDIAEIKQKQKNQNCKENNKRISRIEWAAVALVASHPQLISVIGRLF